jgi:hypothetical protein
MHPHPHPHHAIRAQDEGGGQQERQGVYSDLESARWAAGGGGLSRSEGGGGQSIQSVWADANGAWLALRQDALSHLLRAAPHLMPRGARERDTPLPDAEQGSY